MYLGCGDPTSSDSPPNSVYAKAKPKNKTAGAFAPAIAPPLATLGAGSGLEPKATFWGQPGLS